MESRVVSEGVPLTTKKSDTA